MNSEVINDSKWVYLEELNIACNQYNLMKNANFYSGLCAALASSSEQVPAEEWLVLVFGGSNIKSGDNDTIDKLVGLVFTLHNNISKDFDDINYEPFLIVDNDLVEFKLADDEAIKDWCTGYCKGVDVARKYWNKMQYEISLPMALISGLIDGELPKEENGEDINWPELLPELAQDIYEFGNDKTVGVPFNKNKSSKVGRNDLCSCGSNKKYKKCCLIEEKEQDLMTELFD